MIMKVDFEECLKDSPRFRAAVEDVEGDVGELESKLDKLVKLSIGMIDAGRVYSHANRQFISGIRDLALQSSRDDVIGSSLAAFAETLQEMNNYHTILFDQAQRSVRSQLQTFVKEDLRKFKEVKKQFDKASEEKDVALVKNAQVPRNKPHEVDEATNTLTTTRKCFRHIALDYVLQINVLQSKKRLELLKSMLSFMNSNLSFFQQGYTLFSDLEPLMKQLGDSWISWSSTQQRRKETWSKNTQPSSSRLHYRTCPLRTVGCRSVWTVRMELLSHITHTHTPVILLQYSHTPHTHPTHDELYDVSCRSLGVHNSKVRSLTLDSWEPELLKLMCELGNELINQIYEARRGELCWRKPQPGDSRQEIEAYIRAKYVERRFVRKQDSQEQRSKVMMLSKHDKHLKGSVEFLPPRPPPPTPRIHPSSKSSAPLSGQEARRDSLFCPDELDSLFSYFDTSSKLRSLKSADSGIHTSTDGSREMLNSSSNTSLSEPDVQEAEPVHESPPLPPCVVECSPSLLLYWASCASSLSDMVEALALGADVNWAHGEDQRRTALMQAVQGGSLLPCEFLLQNSANVDQQDARGRGALHHAAMLGHTGQVCLFLKRGASHSASDMEGRSPLSIAMDTTNADIVTILRMAKVNEEMRESLDQPTPSFYSHSHSEQYRKCIQEFIAQQLDMC
ncbi:arf-GAP with coiled-coil, ANK repeat and PH domain-containing protein 2-like [Silurus meridionalis]|uniref:arf-GAP with coiled-coil, ANK repeat and PH domain-containing protein 2-like n=1 Tax=Silurus meridionalis TaxID=175797 RepID=UPI001EEB1703|nr:arf-GAP with coiled-coil, ANK repeat and PH domain-containing protein 2-like [Silurus meridionalis]